MFKKLFPLGMGLAAIAVPSAAFAAPAPIDWATELADVSLDTSGVLYIFGMVAVGLGLIWAIRKMIKMFNRS